VTTADRAAAERVDLLLAAARTELGAGERALVRGRLEAGIDWTAFVAATLDHSVAPLVHRTLEEVASDLVPPDILDAFRVHRDHTLARNRTMLAELARILGALAERGLRAVPFKGPLLALEAYGDLGLRSFRDLDFLIEEGDLAATLDVLRDLDYVIGERLAAAQIAAIRKAEGQELARRRDGAIAVEPHWRLVPDKLAVSIDHAAMIARASSRERGGFAALALAPEDEVTVLAVHGCKEVWWRLNWACDLAEFLRRHPGLDWPLLFDRARIQGVRRMVLVGAALAGDRLGAAVPEPVRDAIRRDAAVARLLARVVRNWSRTSGRPITNISRLSAFRMLCHDGPTRQAAYVLRVLFLPAARHIRLVALPRPLAFGYVAVKVVHDGVLLPLWRLARPRRDAVTDAEG
jgi:hypothetical protein